MGKRSNFARIPKDLYLTIDPRAVPPVIPFLHWDGIRTFIDPCWGWGHVVGPLTRAGLTCVGRYDLEPKTARKVDPALPGRWGHVQRLDGRDLTFDHLNCADAIITNPPWSRDVLHVLIKRWSAMAPTWLLFDAGWKHSGQAARLLQLHCTDFVPLPRLRWMPGTTDTSKEDCGWYRFHAAEAAQGRGVRYWPLGGTPFAVPWRPPVVQTQAIGA